jgi:glycine cleavage system H protein
MKRYTKEHEWVNIEGTTAAVGISHHAQEALGDITFVELPAVGKVLKAGDPIGVVESVKAASDIYSPVSGTVSEVNSNLDSSPELINQSPEADGWICRLSDVTAADADNLMDEAAYQAFIA